MENLSKDKQKALKDIQIELENIQDYIVDTYNNHVYNESRGHIVPFVETNIEDMTVDELNKVAYDINVLFEKLEQTMDKFYK